MPRVLPPVQELPEWRRRPAAGGLAERTGTRTWRLLAGKIPKTITKAARRC